MCRSKPLVPSVRRLLRRLAWRDTHTHTHRTSTVTLVAHAHRGLMSPQEKPGRGTAVGHPHLLEEKWPPEGGCTRAPETRGQGYHIRERCTQTPPIMSTALCHLIATSGTMGSVTVQTFKPHSQLSRLGMWTICLSF